MKTDDLRQEYIDFFKTKKHKVFASDSLVCDDPSLLFTSAGMNQFKPYFLGQKNGVGQAVSCQRCLRTGDINRVGKTAYHHTFFEMLGNFSFGGYFKKEAIEYAWEFLTCRLKIIPEKLSVSVYKEDQEAFSFWKNGIGLPEKKIFKFGQDQNFWPANVLTQGPNGPCGPCSEVFFDKGDKGCKNSSCGPDCNCGRFVEIWNLVFTQFDRRPGGKLMPLPQKNIDTGMGLERMASVLQEKDSNFKIDILFPVVKKIREIFSLDDSKEKELINSIVDHSRAVIFAIADGVYPSNEKQGYVVRKLLRKALWSAGLLGYREAFIHSLVSLFARLMERPYPFLKEKAAVISKVIKEEEERFLSTLEEGKSKLKGYLRELERSKKSELDCGKLFSLYDTCGFPFELTELISQEAGISVDRCGAEKLLAEQKKRSRDGSQFSQDIFAGVSSLPEKKPTDFIGYKSCQSSVEIIGIFSAGGKKINWEKEKNCLDKENEGVLILDKTPFYPESGGQLSDQGLIDSDGGKFCVESVYKENEKSLYVHKGKVLTGKIKLGPAEAVIDKKRRKSLARAHTTTHLLQAVLRRVLGEHVSQQGSLVASDRLRFDFTHFKALTSREIEAVENMVNSLILANHRVEEKRGISLGEAKREGALAFFKEKYQDKVRVIGISAVSKELCGGIHLENTSEAGGFAVISESSVSSGIRRIEGVCGLRFYQFFQEKSHNLEVIAQILKCSPAKIEPALKKIITDSKDNKSRLIQLEKEKIESVARDLLTDYLEKVEDKNLLVYDFSRENNNFNLNYGNFFDLLDLVKTQLKTFFIFFIAKSKSKIRFLSSSSPDLNEQGLGCREFVLRFGSELSLKGGGQDRLVQGVVIDKKDGLTRRVKELFKEFVKNADS